jgi:protein-L-isoaspartate(D-aspartate) O-methyltransferase
MGKLGRALTPPTQKIRLILELRRAGITDTAILSAFEKVPRELFVPEAFLDQAWENTPLPIGQGQTISQPTVVARMIQALRPDRGVKVLEVGCGSGYQTAVLSHLFRRVYAIERQAAFLRAAIQRLSELRRHNVTTKPGDGSLGWREQAPFDRILVAAAAEDLPPALWDQLAPDGIMVCPIGEAHDEQRLMRFIRRGTACDGTDLGPVRFVPLVGGPVERPLKRAAG